MLIHGREIKFLRTVQAACDIADICPKGDMANIGKLFDVSAVSLPANDATEISSRTISDGLIAEAMEEVRAEEERQRKIGEIRKILKGEDNHDE